MGRFLLQVSKDAGYNNIINEHLYRNRSWATKPKDKDHGDVKPGDELIVYCTGSVPTYGSSLAFSVIVKEVSPDKITFELDEPQWFASPLKIQEITSSVFRNELPDIFRKCGQQGFNIAKLQLESAQHRETIDRLVGTGSKWHELVKQAKQVMTTFDLEEIEIGYKVEIGQRLAEARKAVLAGSTGWSELLKRGMIGNIVYPIQIARFRDWVDGQPEDAVGALRALWTRENLPIADRISSFSKLFPTSATGTKGAGTRMNVVSQLLMAVDVEDYPPFRVRFFEKTYKRTGYPQLESGADEATLYEHALGFLDRFIKEADNRGLKLRHRLDAQSVLWLLSDIEEEDDDNELWQNDKLKTPLGDPDLAALARDTYLTEGFLKEIVELLEDKKQVIFQGPPGTGKTYVAQALAECLAGSKSRVTLVQFHPSYAYEDFVQGFRPESRDGQPRFELKDGPLRRAAEKAKNDTTGGKHFLVIDEINRGNLAKVFGELYFLLEYRDREMDLQYSDSPFSLPDNLYIIGTMNTADRSIALVDLALRRRFHFKEFHPDDEPVKGVLRRYLGIKAPGMEWVADVVERANVQLQKDRDAAIGPSYFMKDNLTEDSVQRIWQHNVLPYLKELLYGRDEELAKFHLDVLRSGEAAFGPETDSDDESEPTADPHPEE